MSNINSTFIHQLVLYIMSIRKLVLPFSNQDLNSTYSKLYCHHKYYMEYSICNYKPKLYCINQNRFANTESSKLLSRVTTKRIEDNHNDLCQQSRQERYVADKIRGISLILWLMHNYLTALSRLKYRRCQPRLSTSLLHFTFLSDSIIGQY